MKEIALSCTCGGTVTVKVPETDRTAVAECICGRVLMWSEDSAASSDPPPLGISVHDTVRTIDKFGR